MWKTDSRSNLDNVSYGSHEPETEYVTTEIEHFDEERKKKKKSKKKDKKKNKRDKHEQNDQSHVDLRFDLGNITAEARQVDIHRSIYELENHHSKRKKKKSKHKHKHEKSLSDEPAQISVQTKNMEVRSANTGDEQKKTKKSSKDFFDHKIPDDIMSDTGRSTLNDTCPFRQEESCTSDSDADSDTEMPQKKKKVEMANTQDRKIFLHFEKDKSNNSEPDQMDSNGKLEKNTHPKDVEVERIFDFTNKKIQSESVKQFKIARQKKSKDEGGSKNEQFVSDDASLNPTHLKWNITESEKKKFEERGIKLEKGKWKQKEVNTLERNLLAFFKRHKIVDTSGFLFSNKEDVKNARKEWNLYVEAASGINRSLSQVYRKIERMYNPLNHKGTYSKKEKEELIDLQQRKGNKWREIGEELSRSASSVEHKFATLKCKVLDQTGRQRESVQEGKWKEDEISRLNNIMQQFTDKDSGEIDYSKLHWDAIANFVGTRNSLQCRRKWTVQLSWRKASDADKIWRLKKPENQKFNVQILSQLNQYTEEAEIDWEEVRHRLGVLYSVEFLRKRWYSLKVTAPDYQRLDFESILNWLEENYVLGVKNTYPMLFEE